MTPSFSAALPVYVISLADADVRRANMTARLSAAAIPFRFVDAVDGRTRRVPDQIDGARIIREPFGAESAIACTISHRLVHRMIADGDAETALILEDDAKLDDDFSQVVQHALSFDFDIFKLEGMNVARRRITIGRIGQRQVIVTIFPSSGAAAYLVRREAARRICALPVIDQVNDLIFADPRFRLRVLELDPFCARQDCETESEMNRFPNPSYVPPKIRGIRRLMTSFRRKIMIATLHGPLVLIRFELQKVEPMRNTTAMVKWTIFAVIVAAVLAGIWLHR
jgi:GR25 family glycosyltransferase involved in LPS biosynthesis